MSFVPFVVKLWLFEITQEQRIKIMALDDVMLETEEKMESAVDYLKQEFRGIRTGRASAGLVDHMKVEYYGSPTDLRQLASISTPDASRSGWPKTTVAGCRW